MPKFYDIKPYLPRSELPPGSSNGDLMTVHMKLIGVKAIDAAPLKVVYVDPQDGASERYHDVYINKVFTLGYIQALKEHNLPISQELQDFLDFAQKNNKITLEQPKTPAPEPIPVDPPEPVQQPPEPPFNKYNLLDLE